MHWNYKAKQTSFYGMFISTIMMICQMQICNLVICSSIILVKMFTSCEQNITLKRVLNQNHVENTIQQPAKKLNCIRKLHNFTTVQSLYFIVGNTWTNTFWVGIISLIFIFYWGKNNFCILKTHFRTSTLQHKCNKEDDITNWQAI